MKKSTSFLHRELVGIGKITLHLTEVTVQEIFME